MNGLPSGETSLIVCIYSAAHSSRSATIFKRSLKGSVARMSMRLSVSPSMTPLDSLRAASSRAPELMAR